MALETNKQVLSIVENIKKDIIANPEISDTKLKKINKGLQSNPMDLVKGKPKSGRFWKSERQRFSTVNKTKGLKQDFQRKTMLRLELKHVKELSKQKQEELHQKQLEKKERRRQNILKAEENKRKAEIVQVITNTAKIRRMRKKQLRFIQKRDTTKEVEAAK